MAGSILAGAAGLGGVVATTALLMAPGVAAAQDYTAGDLRGRVEADGKAIAGATVTVRSPQGVTRTATTDSQGQFAVPALPFGPYTADVSASGYDKLTNQRVSVAPGGSSFTFTLSAPGTAVSELVVTAASRTRATVDFSRTDTGLTVNVAELSNRVPVARNIESIALLSPSAGLPDPTLVENGVRRGNQSPVTLAGTSAAENSYYINGLNVTDQRTFLGYATVPFDAIQNEDVKTGGYSAEFGRATGGVVSVSTKSGTNEYHAGGSVFYAPEAFRGHSPVAYGVGGGLGGVTVNSVRRHSSLDADVYLSGPIIKDRLFFFGVFAPHMDQEVGALVGNSPPNTATAGSGTWEQTRSNTPHWLTKWDLNITDNQRLEATLFSDIDKIYRRACPYTLYEGCTGSGLDVVNKTGGLNQIYKYTGTFTDWFTLSALYGKVNSNYTDYGPLVSTSMVRDQRSGGTTFLTQAVDAGPYNLGDKDVRDTYRIDADFYAHLFGSHHFRVGYDLEKLRSTAFQQYSGGGYYDIRSSARNPTSFLRGYTGDYVRATFLTQGGSFKANQSAFYAEDSWRITPNLTLQLGVRNDIYDYKTASGESFIKTSNQWAPRVGVSWDPSGRGDDRVYGSFGRYYLPIAENTAIRVAASAPFFRQYYTAVINPDGTVAQQPNGQPVLGSLLSTQTFSTAATPDPRTIAASNIEPMFSQEFIIGYEHIFREGALTGVKAGVRYIDRHLGQTIEDTNLQETDEEGTLSRYCARTGIADCHASDYTGFFTLINPGNPARVYVDIDGTGAKYITLTKQDLGLPPVKNRFQAFEFTLERPFDGKWGLQGSYVLSRSKGNYEGAVNSDIGQTDTSITQAFDTFLDTEGASGYLPNDHRHTFKLFGTYAPVDNFLIGANFFLQSGRPYGCIGYNPAEPNPSPTPGQWFCQGVETPRGSKGRTDWVSRLDLSFIYKIPTRDGWGQPQVSVEIFNVFNNHAITRVVEQGEQSGLPGSTLVTYGLPRTYQEPRSVRFGIRYAY